MRLREDFTGDYRNIILSNMPGYNFVLEGAAGDENEADQTWDNYDSGEMMLTNLYIWGNALGWEKGGTRNAIPIPTWKRIPCSRMPTTMFLPFRRNRRH